MNLYKYKSFEENKHIANMILNNEIYLSQLSELNDPFDIRPVVSLKSSKSNQIKDFIKLLKKHDTKLNRQQRRKFSQQQVNDLLSTRKIEKTEDSLQENLINSFNKDIGIFCLSTEKDNILMWSHYADSHKGICLEYDREYFLIKGTYEVKYFKDRPSTNEYHNNNDDSLDKSFLSKYEGWSYEKEWRHIDYEIGPGLYTVDKCALKSIYIGASASKNTTTKVIELAIQRGKDLNIYKMKTDNRKYALQCEKINY